MMIHFVLFLCSGIMDDFGGKLENLILTDADFPEYFVNWAHPEDYILVENPFKPEYIYPNMRNKESTKLLLMRACFELPESKKFLPMTFVLHSGAPNSLYLSEQARSIFGKEGLLEVNSSMMHHIKVFGQKCEVEPFPYKDRGANLIGNPLLAAMGMQMTMVLAGFNLSTMPLPYFSATLPAETTGRKDEE